jgi:hypothetical protein
VAHQAADEVDVAAEPVELGDDDWRALAAALGGVQRRGELRPTIQGVSPLARLDLGEGLQQIIALNPTWSLSVNRRHELT